MSSWWYQALLKGGFPILRNILTFLTGPWLLRPVCWPLTPMAAPWTLRSHHTAPSPGTSESRHCWSDVHQGWTGVCTLALRPSGCNNSSAFSSWWSSLWCKWTLSSPVRQPPSAGETGLSIRVHWNLKKKKKFSTSHCLMIYFVPAYIKAISAQSDFLGIFLTWPPL